MGLKRPSEVSEVSEASGAFMGQRPQCCGKPVLTHVFSRFCGSEPLFTDHSKMLNLGAILGPAWPIRAPWGKRAPILLLVGPFGSN